MDIDQVARDIGKLIKDGKESALVEIFKSEVELSDMQRGNFLSELLHKTANRIKYVKEPAGRDDWQAVEYTLMTSQGDCEDFTILIGAVLLRAGYPVLLKFTASENEFDHVVPLSWDGNAWVVLDATLSNIGLDFEGSYNKSVVYTLDGVTTKKADAFYSGYVGWVAAVIILAVLLLRIIAGG